MADWLESKGCTHVAMESTGVYSKSVWHVLEGRFEVVLANAMQVRNMPGRKSDVNDATWIAELLARGLIRSSSVPPAAVQELRDSTRTRKQLVREVARHTLRVQKTLEDANIKLTSSRQLCPGDERASDPGGPCQRRERPRTAGRLGDGSAQGKSRADRRSAARKRY